MSLNKILLIGNLGKDAETRTAGDAQVASFTVATTETWKDRSGNRQWATEWNNCEYWNPGGVLPFLTKGRQVYLEGTLRTEEWTDKDGIKRKTQKVRVLSLQLLGGKQDDAAPRQASQPAQQFTPQARPVPSIAETGNVFKDPDDLPY